MTVSKTPKTNTAADELLALVDKHGSKLCGSQIGQLLCGKKADSTRFLMQAIKQAGGLKKFCDAHESLKFVTDGGCGYVMRSLNPERVVTALLKLVDEGNGKLSGSQVSLLYQKQPEFRGIVETAGGLKKFCMKCDQLSFSSDGGAGCVRRKIAAPAVAAAVAGTVRHSLRAKDIRWCQDTIKLRFRNGELLAETLQELLRNPSMVQELPVLEVVQRGEDFYAVNGNRRLWVLKEYSAIQEMKGRSPLAVRVKVLNYDRLAPQSWFKERFSTRCEGTQVEIVVKHRCKNYERFPTMVLAMAAEMRDGCKGARSSGSDVESTVDGDSSSTSSDHDA